MSEVLVNHMYSGNYLETGNLGHEVINLFKCDNGQHYIYAMSAGDYDTKRHYKNIKKVILVRNVDQYKAEILSIGDVVEDIFALQVDEPKKYKMMPSVEDLVKNDFMNPYTNEGKLKDLNLLQRIDTYKKIHKCQIEYINKNEVTYGGVKLYDLFSENNTAASGHSIYITFKVDNFKRSNELIYLCDSRIETDDPHYFIIKNKDRMCGASIATFENTEDSEIQRLINSNYWENNDNSQKVEINNITHKSISFLNIIKKNNDELTYSNWITFYLRNDKELLKKFIKHFTKEETSFDKIEIIRESKDNIDIYYEDSTSIFIFENKIKSSINGTKKKNGITEEEKEFSQLAKYYDFVENESKNSNFKKKTGYFYIASRLCL